ncbi:MAG: hypothetical protein PHX53_17420 [Syntrophales bacterium]|nr:hypothetical protein [Syntrophales bacterium]
MPYLLRGEFSGKGGVVAMWQKIGVVLCLLLFAGAFAGGQQTVFAKDPAKTKQNSQKQEKSKQSFKDKYKQKVNKVKEKIRKKMEPRRSPAALAVRG